MDVNVTIGVITCGTAIVACVTTTGLILWKGGAQAERVESSVRKIERLESRLEILDKIPALERAQTQLENTVHRLLSDHAQLRARVDETRDTAIRAEMASQHDIGGE